jgi:hypothetical protein
MAGKDKKKTDIIMSCDMSEIEYLLGRNKTRNKVFWGNTTARPPTVPIFYTPTLLRTYFHKKNAVFLDVRPCGSVRTNSSVEHIIC